jgi:3-mercaptopyruvate sulfurtransferase SseA
MERYTDLVADALTRVKEIQPWDLSKLLATGGEPVLLDVREPAEYAALHIPGAINVGYWNNPANGISTRPCPCLPPAVISISW